MVQFAVSKDSDWSRNLLFLDEHLLTDMTKYVELMYYMLDFIALNMIFSWSDEHERKKKFTLVLSLLH